MASITKPLLKELFNYAYRHKILKNAIRDRFDNKFKGKSKEDCCAYLNDKCTKDEAVSVVLGQIHAVHQTFFAFESIDGAAFTAAKIRAGINALRTSYLLDEKILHLEKSSSGVSLEGIYAANYDGYFYNESTDEYEGAAKTFNFLVPFRITFSAPKHVKISVMKFSPGTWHRNADGRMIDIKKNNFSEELAVMHLLNTVVPKVLDFNLIQCNLTTGIKALVQDEKLGAIQAGADDGEAEGRNNRTKHHTAKGSLLEKEWYQTHLLPSKKLDKTRWFWVDGKGANPEIADLDCLTVDCELGTCSKDRSDEQDHEWMVDEILKRNN